MYRADQIPQPREDFVGVRGVGPQHQRQPPHPLAILRDQVRVHRDHRCCRQLVTLPAEILALGLASGHRLADLGEVDAALGNRGDQALDCLVEHGDAPV
ncbi:hypothetical protein [Sphingomonas jinjuensis]|uniref:hypothetical protein n=1 Tax=Sphingomonas jinjuensis TaxID=535907 RepID=UPI0031B5E2E2